MRGLAALIRVICPRPPWVLMSLAAEMRRSATRLTGFDWLAQSRGFASPPHDGFALIDAARPLGSSWRPTEEISSSRYSRTLGCGRDNANGPFVRGTPYGLVVLDVTARNETTADLVRAQCHLARSDPPGGTIGARHTAGGL